MKLLAKALAFLALLLAAPALAEPVVVLVGDDNAATTSGYYAHAYDAAHANFNVVQGTDWGVDEAQANLSSITSLNPDYVVVALGTYDLGSYANAAAWVSDLYSLFASIRAARPTVKIVAFTLNPRTGDANHTSFRQAVNDALRADEGNGTGADYLFDIAANPTMSVSGATSDTNLYTSEASITHYVACPATCAYGGTKGHAYIYKQFDYGMIAVLAGKLPWTVYPVTATYSASPVVPTAETAPALTLAQPADIATAVSLTGWTTTDPSPSTNYRTLPPGDTPKFRTIINSTHVARLDPVRNFRDTIAGHCHLFFGNASVDENSTYTSLRATGASSAGGGPVNPTGYWEPCMTKANAHGGDGITRVKIPNYHIVYYVGEASIQSEFNNIPRGLRYIGGTNMDDPNNLAWKAELNANVTWLGNGLTNANTGWFCEFPSGGGGSYQSTTDALVNADGTDALNNCPTSSAVYVSVVAPECWDGVNLRSPSGYDHMRPLVHHTNLGTDVCADNWYRLPRLEVKSFFSHLGASDYTTWRLDSDDVMAALTGAAVKSGYSFHFDWFGAWDYTKMLSWMNNCIGTQSGTAHECDYSVIGNNVRMISDSAAPDSSRNPQTNTGHTYAGDLIGDWFDYPAMEMAAATRARGRFKLRAGF